ncbi:MAG: hypothetical protein HY823_15035 [Acidobacteria bacterium]|nr:hypothetical protein [Acidobacteriota bacterium]
MKFQRIALLLAGTLIAGSALLAQDTATPKREAQVERRAARQQKRIAQGVATGQLTPKEAARLEKREAHIQKDIAKAEADGKITRKEQAHINAEENKASRKIYQKKHNPRSVPKK